MGDRTEEAYQVCGYDALVSRYGVEFWDMQKDTASERDCAGMALKVCDKTERPLSDENHMCTQEYERIDP